MSAVAVIVPEIGDLVCYFQGFGKAALARVHRFGTKDGERLVDLSNGKWCYLTQISRIVESHDYLTRVEALIEAGCDRGDAQAIVECQDEKAGRVRFVG